MKKEQLHEFLESNYLRYSSREFIETDPIQIPHRFVIKEDIEIAGFLAATIAWGQRKSIIKSAKSLMSLMDESPYQFITQASRKELSLLDDFVYRTFQTDDCLFFIESLRNIYLNKGGLQTVFENGYNEGKSIYHALAHFRDVFLSTPHLKRSEKHISNVKQGASAKRLNMFLRWMTRKDHSGVDFGLWENIPMSSLMLPLDVHTGNVSRKLGLLKRNSDDWNAVEELTKNLRTFDRSDPVKYDFALFGLGVFEGYGK